MEAPSLKCLGVAFIYKWMAIDLGVSDQNLTCADTAVTVQTHVLLCGSIYLVSNNLQPGLVSKSHLGGRSRCQGCLAEYDIICLNLCVFKSWCHGCLITAEAWSGLLVARDHSFEADRDEFNQSQTKFVQEEMMQKVTTEADY